MKIKFNKIISLVISAVLFSNSILPVCAAEPRVAVIECNGTFYGTPQIVSVTKEENTVLANIKFKMPYTYTFSQSTTFGASASVTSGVELGLDEILTIGRSVSVTLDTSVTYQQEHSVYYDEPGYRYVKPVLFTEFTTVKVPVHPEISNGLCALQATNTYIKYPTDYILDGYYYTAF